MIKPVALANAISVIFAVAYISCGIIAFVVPDLYWGILNSWMHGVNLELVKATNPMSIGTFVFGVVTFTAYIWVVSYLGAILYKNFSK